MGLIRRSALDQVGGWDEWCITEDAEVSLRLLRAGWSGLHVDASWGHGVMPLTFEALKSQRYRWCFGGIQIMRMHSRRCCPARADRNRLTPGSAGRTCPAPSSGTATCSAWSSTCSCWSARSTWRRGGQLFRKLSAFLLAAVPVLVILGLARALALLRRGTGATWRDAFGAFFIWQSTSVVVARASVQALVARRRSSCARQDR